MPSFGHLDKTSHLFVHLTRPTPNSGPLRNLLPGISSYPQKLRPGGTLFFGTAKSKDRNLDQVSDRGRFRSHLKVGMSSGTEIHGFSPVGSQYGIFGPVPRYFPRNLQKPETRPIFAMAKMSPRESHFLAVGVVRWAPNLHMFNSTHQDLSFHGECRLISDGKGWYQCPVGWVIGTPNLQHG